MARWKPVPRGVGDPPRENQRIDGNIFTYNQQTNTINKWSYPNRSQSPRFNTINETIKNLDAHYDTLSGAQKTAWQNFFHMNFWELVCWIFDEDGNPLPPPDTGVASYRATNIARMDQGLAFVDNPPTNYFHGINDTVVFTTPQWHAKFFITHTPDPRGYYWQIYGRPANTAPIDTPQPDKKLVYIATQNINIFTDYDLTSLLTDSGLYGSCNWRALEIRVGTRGCPCDMRFRPTA